MKAKETLLFASPAVKVLDFQCLEEPHTTSEGEVCGKYEITFTRSGHFQFRDRRGAVEIDSRILLLANAGTERVVSHDCLVGDRCTILQVPQLLLEEAERIFYRKGVLPSVSGRFPFPVAAIPSTPELDLLHHRLYESVRGNPSQPMLKLEGLTIQLLAAVFRQLYQRDKNDPVLFADEKLKDQHRESIERAKAYILLNMDRDLTLRDIARHAFVSEFHFSRLFKRLTAHSPYQYLLEARLHHAALLLRDSVLSVTEICFASGFNSFPHFVASFSRRNGMSPRAFRKRK